MESLYYDLINKLNLQAHPEGGYYKETYRSKGIIETSSLSQDIEGERNYSTAIYFLLAKNQFSAFHKIKQDEIWHFYSGTTLLLHTINKEGEYKLVRIGQDLNNEEYFQYVVPAGTLFASEVEDKNSFSFCGCTVSPGFDFKDFTMPSRVELIKTYPKHSEIILKLTHGN